MSKLDDLRKVSVSSKGSKLDQIRGKEASDLQNKFGGSAFGVGNNPLEDFQPIAGPKRPTQSEIRSTMPSRNIPIIGEAFKALDIAGEKIEPAMKIARSFYTPGGGVKNVLGMTNAVGSVVSQVAPRLGSTLGGRVATEAIKEGVTGVPLGIGQSLATGETDLGDAAKQGIIGGALGAGVGGAFPLVGKAFQSFLSRNKVGITQKKTEQLALPPASEESLKAYNLRNRPNVNVLEPNTTPIRGQGDIHTFELPESNTPRIVDDIKKQAIQDIKPPAKRRELISYVEKHLEIPRAEVVKLSDKDLYEMGQAIRSNTNMDVLHTKLAKEQGHKWDELVSGKSVTGVADSPVSNFKYKGAIGKTQSIVGSKEVAGPISTNLGQVKEVPKTRLDQMRAQTSPSKQNVTDELKFAETARVSENTAPSLAKALEEKPLVGSRTTDVLNRKQAVELITKHGQEGLYAKLMSKTKQFSPSETTAAQILAKQYSSLGGDANLSKAIDLVSKTAKGSREMGQAIQALSQWNKLDQSGALLLGERQLNKGVTDMSQWKKLSTAQAAPIQEAAQRAETAVQTKSLADEVLSIVTNKAGGEALTEADKATIKQFNDQVKTINEKTSAFLPKEKVVSKADKIIKEVSGVEPRQRSRDQVVSFLSAKADKARARIAASRNKISSTPFDIYADYAIIGAEHIAKGVVRLADFTEIMARDFGDSVKPNINGIFHKATNIFRKEQGLPTLEELDKVVRNAVKNDRFTKEEANRFKAWANEIGYYADKNMKIEATQDLQAAIKELGESTLGQKISTVQTGAMLLNAVTMSRNIAGNTALVVSEKLNKIAAIPIDWALSGLTKERTIQWMPKNQENLLRNFMGGTESGWKGVSPTGTLDSYGIHPNVFGKRNPLRYITKSLGASMQGFDYAAYKIAYGDVLATYGEQLGKAQGLSKADIKMQMPKLIEQLDSRIYEIADEAGLYATFQDDTLLSQGAEMFKSGLNKITDFPMQKAVERGLVPKRLSTEGFGLGDVVLKFAKTPANLVMRAVDYSPIGIMHGLMQLAPLFMKGAKFNQFKATRALSRGITGTLGLSGVGFALANAGILTGSSSIDKDVRSIQEQSGQGAYKVNLSALTRYISSGLDKSSAKFREGDRLMDYQWLQPAAISVAMGVNANKSVSAKKSGLDVTGWQIAGRAILGGLQTVLENPMVQGLSNVVDAGIDIVKRQDPTKLKNIAKGVPASFVPTLSNQARTSTDNLQRETFDANVFTEIGNLMANKVPGLSKNLPISYDSLGNARERIQGGQEDTVKQYLKSFFSPAKMTEYEVSPEAKIVLQLMEDTGDASVLPRISDRYIHISQSKNQKDLKVNLTGEQYSKLQERTGKMVTRRLAAKSSQLSNPNRGLQSKVDIVKSILTDVGKTAREEIGGEMGYKKKDVKK